MQSGKIFMQNRQSILHGLLSSFCHHMIKGNVTSIQKFGMYGTGCNHTVSVLDWPNFHLPQSQISIVSPDFHQWQSQKCLLGCLKSVICPLIEFQSKCDKCRQSVWKPAPHQVINGIPWDIHRSMLPLCVREDTLLTRSSERVKVLVLVDHIDLYFT